MTRMEDNVPDERRTQEMEERLERFTAPEPPEGLLEAIRQEIDDHLPEPVNENGDGGGFRHWRLLAASLAIAAVGASIAYRVKVEGPALDQPAVPEAELGAATVPEASGQGERTSGERESGAATSVELGDPSQGREVSLPGREEAKPPEPVVSDHQLRSELQSLGYLSPDPPPSAAAQVAPAPQEEAARGSLEMRVRSQDGSPLPGATVVLDADGETRVEVSDAEGRVEFDDVQAGEHSVSAELGGMSKVEYPKVKVAEERKTRLDASMPPEVEETITVTSESPLLDERNSSTVEPPKPKRVAPLTANDGIARRLREEPSADLVAPPVAHMVAPSTGGTAEPNEQPYGDMFFEGYGTNPFIDTEDDALSTFALDVDTGSYTVARSYLERGELPPADAIRVEEFVNYFDYGDPAPARRDFAAVVEGAPSPFASTARTWLLRFALKGREIDVSRRAPAMLTFVVDVSGSMNRENRLGLVKRALRLLVGQLDRGDAIGLVVYGSSGQVLLSPTNDHERVLAAIDRLVPTGATNAEEGLVLGYREARRAFVPGAINRVILCSDGVANAGATGPDSILERIGREADEGIELTTVGFGMGNYNDVLMEQLADRGDGNYAYVDDLDEARRVFVGNLTGTLQTIAGDAKVQVEFEPGMVQSYRLLGYENRDVADRDFRNDAVDAGEIGAGHQVTALYEVKLRDDAPRRGRLATMRLRYRSKATGSVVEDSVELGRDDLVRRPAAASGGWRLAAVVAEFAEVLRGSYWARESDLGLLAATARELSAASGSPETRELARLIETASRLRAGRLRDGGGGGAPGIER